METSVEIVGLCETKVKTEVETKITRNIATGSVKFTKSTTDTLAPVRKSPYAAGFTLFGAHESVIPSRGSGVIDTNIQLKLPVETYGRISMLPECSRHILIGAGVIDADYRVNVKVLIFNHGTENCTLRKYGKIAQLIVSSIYSGDIVEVQALDETVRGEKGFGSTGVRDILN